MLFLYTTIDGLQNGVCFFLLAIGVYLSYSVLDLPDMTVDGSFPLGGVAATVLMLRLGFSPLLATLLAFFFGAAAGCVTGLLHVKGRISPLLAGIIVMTGLSSVTLAATRLLSSAGNTVTVFSYRGAGLSGLFGGEVFSSLSRAGRELLLLSCLLAFALFAKLAADLLLSSRLGYLLRATGENEHFVFSLGKNAGSCRILGLALANGAAAVSGALYTQMNMSYDNTSGAGKAVLALASVIIGTAVFSRLPHIRPTTAVLFGTLVYSLCLHYLVLVDPEGIWLKLLNAVLFAVILLFRDRLSSLSARRRMGGARYARSYRH